MTPRQGDDVINIMYFSNATIRTFSRDIGVSILSLISYVKYLNSEVSTWRAGSGKQRAGVTTQCQ